MTAVTFGMDEGVKINFAPTSSSHLTVGEGFTPSLSSTQRWCKKGPIWVFCTMISCLLIELTYDMTDVILSLEVAHGLS